MDEAIQVRYMGGGCTDTTAGGAQGKEFREKMRIALTLMLLIASSPAWAEWVKVYFDDQVSTYIDVTSIHGEGSLRRVWQVEDEKENVHDGVMSRRGLWEYDCVENKFRLLEGSDHSGQMGRGNVISFSDTPSYWFVALPGTNVDAILRIVCAQ